MKPALKPKLRLLSLGVFLLALICGLTFLREYLHVSAGRAASNAWAYYQTLPPGPAPQDALRWLHEDFTADRQFTGNLPLVVLQLEGEPPVYKKFVLNGQEVVYEDVEPWIGGRMYLYDDPSGENTLADEPALTSWITVKTRGHTSINFDKQQYYIKTVTADGQELAADVFGMGAGEAWVLNGSMADKSMLRNYLAYRVAASIMEYAPRCRYCEMFTLEDGVYTYQGVYLMTEAVKRGANRVNIDANKRKNVYTSYLVRRDRYTSFDSMLDTYGRLAGQDEGWIGVKYPAVSRQTPANLAYIAQDFSHIEQVLYAREPEVFGTYSRFIDVASFVDYFLINEYFGNYDAGEHSTYMYKNTGDRLKIGPVWDFDQAMNNSVVDETDPTVMAMQARTFFRQLVRDTVFLDALNDRYAELRRNVLSDKHIFALIDETTAYLSAAQRREWYRWAADYLEGGGGNPHNYYLSDYVLDDVTLSRFNDDYQQEIYTIKVYLHNHGRAIPIELKKLYASAEVTTGLRGENTLFLLLLLILFILPSVMINRWR